MQKNYTRRKMLKDSALIAGGICTCQALAAFTQKSDCCNTPDLESGSYTIKEKRIVIDLAKATSLTEPGHAAFISVPDQKIEIILVHPEQDQFFALSRFCTHGRQVLSYNRQRGLLQCNSYNHSLFELTGQVYKGPAPNPLDTFKVEKDSDQLMVYL